MHAVGIVAAAGSGLRLGADRPKALVPLTDEVTAVLLVARFTIWVSGAAVLKK